MNPLALLPYIVVAVLSTGEKIQRPATLEECLTVMRDEAIAKADHRYVRWALRKGETKRTLVLRLECRVNPEYPTL